MSLEETLKPLSKKWMHILPGGSSLRLGTRYNFTHRDEFLEKTVFQATKETLGAFLFDIVKIIPYSYIYAYLFIGLVYLF